MCSRLVLPGLASITRLIFGSKQNQIILQLFEIESSSSVASWNKVTGINNQITFLKNLKRTLSCFWVVSTFFLNFLAVYS